MISVQELIAIFCYIAILFVIGIWSARRHQTASDFLIGGRSLNFYLTALSAHASDMSAWLFMGLPAKIFSQGLFESWFAIGLLLFMFLNWLLIAPRIRIKTEEYNSLTFSSFFESRFHDTSGVIRIFTALISLLFYTVYLTAGAIAMGDIIQILFSIDYSVGMTIGLCLVAIYLFIGGYRTLAWVDCFQALFLLGIIVIVPIAIVTKIGGWHKVSVAFTNRDLSLSLLPDSMGHSTSTLFILLLSWGIGYFGQPHIVTKFMGIAQPSHLRKSMAIGMTWQLIALSAATFVGVIGVAFFTQGVLNPEYVFINMVKDSFPPMISAFILCAVLAAILSTMDSQMLVLASSLTEDFYKRILRKTAGSKELLWISRLFILMIALFVYGLALFKIGGIYNLVAYSWSGLGASFGPLLIFALFSKKTTKYGAWAGVLTGGIVVNGWFYLTNDIRPALPTAFLLSSLAIYIGSKVTYKKKDRLEGEA
ncbi:MAG: sodium/proline symporter [Chlamydiota bacterium]